MLHTRIHMGSDFEPDDASSPPLAAQHRSDATSRALPAQHRMQQLNSKHHSFFADDSFVSGPPQIREANRHDNSIAPGHNWQGFQKQDGSSVSQAAAAGKLADLEAAELSETGARADIVRKKLLGQLAGLDRKINRKKKIMPGNPSRVCRHCNRQFPSGRALGGHMRVHGALFADPLGAGLIVEAESKEEQHFTSSAAKSSSDPAADYRIGNSNSTRKDHSHMLSSRSKEHRWSGSGFRSSRALPTKSSEDSIMLREEEEKDEEEEDARSERESISSEANYEDDDAEFSSDDDQFIEDRMISSSYRKEHSLGSLEFNNHDSRLPSSQDEFLEDGMQLSSDYKRNPLYELRRNPKRSRRFTDQEFALDVLAANPAVAFTGKRSVSASPERARACSECGKVFLSWKALFGHMRCHPEREWRGIQPPESSLELERGARIRKRSPAEYSYAENSELELESDLENKEGRASFKIPEEEGTSIMKGGEEATTNKKEKAEEASAKIDGGGEECINRPRSTESMPREFMDDWTPRWPTGKRSKRRRPTVPALQITSTQELGPVSETTSIAYEDEDQEELDMANCLVMLACAGSRLEELDRNRVESTEESAFSDSGRNQVAEQGPQEDSLQALEADEADLYDYGDGRGTVNDVQAATSGVKYECNTCKRCFNSHQALGGHRASHRKMKGCFARTNLMEEVHESGEENITTEEEFVSSDLKKWQMQLVPVVEEERASMLHSLDATAKERAVAKKKLKAHECSICHRVFTSGQALGGHKRCHWTGEKIADTASVASSNKQPSTAQTGGQIRKVKEDAIDLNLPAPVDEEDEVAYGTTEVAPAFGRLVEAQKDERIMGSLMDYTGRSNLNGDWTVKELLASNGDSSWGQSGREIEARCMFDGRPAIWSQQWPAGAAQLQQICAMQHL